MIRPFSLRFLPLVCLTLGLGFQGLPVGATALTSTVNFDYAQELDAGARAYRKGDYKQARAIFLKVFRKADGTYHTNPAIFHWLLASMIQSGATQQEVLKFCQDVVKNSPGGGLAAKEARELAIELIAEIEALQEKLLEEHRLKLKEDKLKKEEQQKQKLSSSDVQRQVTPNIPVKKKPSSKTRVRIPKVPPTTVPSAEEMMQDLRENP